MKPNLNLEKSTPEEDALIMEAVKIHGTKWTKIAKMWTPPGDRTAVRTVAWPKSTPIKELGLARIARPHHTLSGRDPRACAPKERGQPPAAPRAEHAACSQSHSSSLSLSACGP